MKVRGAELVVRALEDEGVTHTFGIPGTHNIELYDALDRSERVTPVLVTSEQAASFLACGISSSSAQVGVVNVVPGAGVTHALSGVAEAFLDTVPMVVLACGIRSDTGRAYQLHAIDQLAVLRPVTKAVLAVREAGELYPAVRRAFHIARSGVPGPVAVEVPANLYLLTQHVGRLAFEEEDAAPPSPTESEIAEAAGRLGRARHPVIYLGLGVRHAAPAALALAERLGAPVLTTVSGKGVFPEDHPLFLWNGFGASAPAFVRRVVERCDAMLAVGCRFGEVATASYGAEPPAGTLVHVDIDPQVFGRNVGAAQSVAADAGAFLAALLDEVPPRERDAALEEEIAAGHREVLAGWSAPGARDRVTPHALFGALQELAGPDAVFTADSGNGTFLAMEHLRLTGPGCFLAPVDYSCMGYAVPAAVGAAFANPGRDVVALAGDGALLMTGLELLTAAAYRAAPLVCVLRDGELAQIAQFQRTTLNRATCSVLPPYQVEDFARTAGCRYLKVTGDDDLRRTLSEALGLTRTGIPVMVEVPIDYSRKTFFTRGVVATNFLRLPWSERLRMLARALGRRFSRG